MKKPIAILLSDTHLREETIDVNESIFTQAEVLAQKYEAPLFHLGDVFTSRKSQTLSVLKAAQKNFSKIFSKIVVIPGNHDKVDLRSEDSYLDFVSSEPYVTVVRDFHFVEINKCVFWFLPYFKEEEYISRLKKINVVEKKGYKNFLLTHIGVDGVKNNDSVVVLNNIKQTLFDQFDTVFVGHYHDEAEVGTNIQYIGSAYQNDFGESYHDKGFTLVFEDGTYEKINSTFPRYINVEINLNTSKKGDVEKILKEKEGSTDFVKVKLSGSKEKIRAFDKKRLEEVGIKIQTDYDDIKGEIEKAAENDLITFNRASIEEHFILFCKEKKYDLERGVVYLKEQLNQPTKEA